MFYAFDLLHLAGEDLTGATLQERLAKLPQVVNGSGVLLSIALPGTAHLVIEAVQRLGLEGVIAKRKDSRYNAGQRTIAWVKLKLDRQQLAFSPGFGVGGTPHGMPRFFISHGTADSILPINRCSRVIVPQLRKRGYDVTFREFEGGHEVPADIARDGMVWLAAPGTR